MDNTSILARAITRACLLPVFFYIGHYLLIGNDVCPETLFRFWVPNINKINCFR